MGLQRIPVQKFGGLNTVDAPYDLGPGSSPDLLNVQPVQWDDDESIMLRGGLFDTTNGAGLTGAGTYTMNWPAAGGAFDGAGTLWWGSTAASGTAFFQKLPGVGSGFQRVGVNGGGSGYTDSYCSALAYPSGGTDPVIYLIPRDSTFGGSAGKFKFNGLTGLLTSWTGGTNIPINVTSMVYWRGRLVALSAANPNRILYSAVGNPDDWGTGPNFVDIYDEDASRNCQLVVHNNNLYLFKGSTLWMIYDPVSFASRLICNRGTGHSANVKGACSCPFTKRLYWVEFGSGVLWSTNGETDLVNENPNSPLVGFLSTRETDFPSSWFILTCVYDDRRKAILVAYNRAGLSANSGKYNDTVEEYVLRGKPSEHPMYRHRFDNYGWLGDVPVPDSPAANGALMSGVSVSFSRILLPWKGTIDESSAYDGYWMGSWMPIISEEPWERVRRISCLYAGTPNIQLTSAMDPRTATAVSQSTTLPLAATNPLDLAYTNFKGPNKKGRYHRLRVASPGAGARFFAVSAVELAIRGGKGHK
jgi:hypothetical protein